MRWQKAAAIFEGGVNAMALAQEVALQVEDHEGWEVQTVGVEIGDDAVIARLGLARAQIAVLVTTWVDGAGVEAGPLYSRLGAPSWATVSRSLDSPTATEIWDAVEAAAAEAGRKAR